MSKSLKKIKTLLDTTKSDLYELQKKAINHEGSEYFTPAYDAYKLIETHTENVLKFIDYFTPPKEREAKYKRLIVELLHLDKWQKLQDQIGNYEEN